MWSDDLCTGGSCFESSHYTTFVCAQAFDDNASTSWANGPDDTAWLGYEFAEVQRVRKLSIMSHDSEDGDRTPSKFEIRASNSVPTDGSSEGTLLLSVDESGGDFWGASETHSWEFENATSYTCYWVYMTDKDGGFGLGAEYMVAEMSMYKIMFSGYFDGYVYEQGSPIVRTLYLYDRSAGSLEGTTTSSGNGYYYLETTYSGSHFIVCLDDAAGSNYNDLIIGNVIPTTISG